MKRLCLLLLILASGMHCFAETLEVNRYRYAGPYKVLKPFVVDSLDVSGKNYKAESILDTQMSFDVLRSADFVNCLPPV